MSYYDTNLQYLMDDLLLNCYDFEPIREKIKELMKKHKSQISNITITLTVIPPSPHSEFIQSCYQQGKIKSYQLKEVCSQIHQTLKTALHSNLEDSLHLFATLKDNVNIKIETKYNVFKILISIKNCAKFSSRLTFAIINHYNMDVLGYCEHVLAEICASKLSKKNRQIILNEPLPKIPLNEQLGFYTLSTKDQVLDFYKCPEVKEILFSYFFPQGVDSDVRTEITFDMLREETFPQKRRKISIPQTNDYMNFHDAITPYTTYDEFLELVDANNILDFYPSVRLVHSGDISTALIDIDVSGFLKTAFSPKVIWEFTITLAEEICTILTKKLCLPYPLITFSGNKGVHLLYKIVPESISAAYGYVNFWELYLLPGQKALTKNSTSLLHSKYTFMRTIIEAIILYTLENLDVDKIPRIIREGLGIKRVMDLFRLSPFDNNKVGILVDSSSNNGSVHRIFSPHPISGLVSIPITDPSTKRIAEKFRDLEVLKEESSISQVVENFKQGKKDQYFQYPPILTRANIETLLEPTKLLPVISIIVRFSDRWVMQRSTWSYQFWYKMYQLNNLYYYIAKLVLRGEWKKGNLRDIYQKVRRIIEESSIKTKEFVKNATDQFFFKRISFNALQHKLDAYRNLEFFYKFKFEELQEIRAHTFEIILIDQQERKNFLRKFKVIFNIILVLLNELFEITIAFSPQKMLTLSRMHIRLRKLEAMFQSSSIQSKNNMKFIVQINLLRVIFVFNILVKFIRTHFSTAQRA